MNNSHKKRIRIPLTAARAGLSGTLALLILATASCAKEENEDEVFLVADICISADDNVSDLKGIITKAAAESNLKILDRSQETFDEMERILKRKPDLNITPASLNMKLHSEGEGWGLIASNLGLSPRQVALAFYQTNSNSPQYFARDILRIFAIENWRVRILEADSTLLPDPNCT